MITKYSRVNVVDNIELLKIYIFGNAGNVRTTCILLTQHLDHIHI